MTALKVQHCIWRADCLLTNEEAAQLADFLAQRRRVQSAGMPVTHILLQGGF